MSRGFDEGLFARPEAVKRQCFLSFRQLVPICTFFFGKTFIDQPCQTGSRLASFYIDA